MFGYFGKEPSDLSCDWRTDAKAIKLSIAWPTVIHTVCTRSPFKHTFCHGLIPASNQTPQCHSLTPPPAALGIESER